MNSLQRLYQVPADCGPSLHLRKCQLLDASAVRWNILWGNDLNIGNCRIWQIGRQFVVVQEGLKHVLQINAKVMVQYKAETAIFDQSSIIFIQIMGHVNIRQ